MKRSELIRPVAVGLAFLLAMIAALKLVYLLFPGLESGLQKFVEAWGLLGVFVGVFVGSSLFPFPTDAFFVSAVSLSKDAFAVAVVGIVAAFAGTLLNYFIARWFSRAFVEKIAGKKALEEARKLVDSYGPGAILVFGVIPVSPVFDSMTFVAGLGGMDAKKFAFYSFVSRVIHYGGLAMFAAKFFG